MLMTVMLSVAGRRAGATIVIDSKNAGDDLGASVNRALSQTPGMLIPEAQIEVVDGRAIESLDPDAIVRTVTKTVAPLGPGDFSVIVTGVATDGGEVAVGAPQTVHVDADEALEIVLPAARSAIASYSVYAGPAGAETLQVQEVAAGTTVRLINPTEFFNRRQGEVPYYPNGPGPPVLMRIVVAAYDGERLVKIGAIQRAQVRAHQSVRVTVPKENGVGYGVFAATGAAPERLQVRGLAPGNARVLASLHGDGELLPSRSQRIEIAPGDYQQSTPMVIDHPNLALICLAPVTIHVRHGFDQSVVVINPAILGAGGDNVGVHRLNDVTIENCGWDMTGQIETVSAPPPDDFRNYALMAWATDGLTVQGVRIHNNLRGGIGVLSCSDVRIESNRIDGNRGRALSDDGGRLLSGRGVGNAINVARNAPFSDAIGDARQTRTVIANNVIVGDDYGEMYGIVATAGGAADNTIIGNTITDVRGACIALEGQNARDSGRSTISGNTCTHTGGIISDNASGGLADSQMRAVAISGNTISASRAAGIAVSSNVTAVVGNVIDGCQLDSMTSGCIVITPPRSAGNHAGTRNLMIANNAIALGESTRAQPPVGVYINGAAPIAHLTLSQNRIDCERVAGSVGVQISGDASDLSLQGNDIGDCGGDGVVVTDFSLPNVKVPQRLTAIDNLFRNLNLSDRWMDGRHPVGAAFRFMIDGMDNVSAGHRLRGNRASDEHDPPKLRYGVIFDPEKPGQIRDVRLIGNEWNARTDDMYDGGTTDILRDKR